MKKNVCATVKEIISVNPVSKFNLLANNKLINEQKKLRTELKVQILVKNERLLNEPFVTKEHSIGLFWTTHYIYSILKELSIFLVSMLKIQSSVT